MRPNARQLALRDPAMAALMGILPANFGSDPNIAGEFGSDWNGDGDMGTDFGFEFGAEAAAPVAPNPNSPAGQAMLANLWNKNLQREQGTRSRARLLEPNKDSAIKVERYTFTISQELTLGTTETITMTGQPDTSIRPQRLTMNAPSPMFATITEIKVANVSVSVGPGSEDAFNYSPLGVGMSLDMPTLSRRTAPRFSAAIPGSFPPASLPLRT